MCYVWQEKFLKERLKVQGKTGNLAKNVSIERQKSKLVVASENAKINLSKR